MAAGRHLSLCLLLWSLASFLSPLTLSFEARVLGSRLRGAGKVVDSFRFLSQIALGCGKKQGVFREVFLAFSSLVFPQQLVLLL